MGAPSQFFVGPSSKVKRWPWDDERPETTGVGWANSWSSHSNGLKHVKTHLRMNIQNYWYHVVPAISAGELLVLWPMASIDGFSLPLRSLLGAGKMPFPRKKSVMKQLCDREKPPFLFDHILIIVDPFLVWIEATSQRVRPPGRRERPRRFERTRPAHHMPSSKDGNQREKIGKAIFQ